ncbi:MAG: hypothetical protein QM528_03710 [Phycisphaerales bacterium]|nr:hypothetical protein [Phycisphaerales bacterium]
MKTKNLTLGSILNRTDLKNDSLKQLKGGLKCNTCGWGGDYCIMPNGNYKCCATTTGKGGHCVTTGADLGCSANNPGASKCYCYSGTDVVQCN